MARIQPMVHVEDLPKNYSALAVRTYKEVGKALHLDATLVRYIERRALAKLRRMKETRALFELCALKHQRDLSRGFDYPEGCE